MNFIELRVRDGDDFAKADAARKGVSISAAILSTRNRTVDVGIPLSRFPKFDWAQYGIRPLFAGTDPKQIEDPSARAAYMEALANHEKLMEQVGTERRKQSEADYAIGCVHRIIDRSAQKEIVGKAAQEAIASLFDADWIKDYIREKLVSFPSAATESLELNSPVQPMQPPSRSLEVRVPGISPIQAQTASTRPSGLVIAKESAQPGAKLPRWGWSAVAFVAAVLLWAFLKNKPNGPTIEKQDKS